MPARSLRVGRRSELRCVGVARQSRSRLRGDELLARRLEGEKRRRRRRLQRKKREARRTMSHGLVVTGEDVSSRNGRHERIETNRHARRNERNVTKRNESIGLPVGKWPRASTRSNPLDSATPMFAHVHWQLLPPFCIKWGPERVVGENGWSQSPKRESQRLVRNTN